jgi:hypothetical protein
MRAEFAQCARNGVERERDPVLARRDGDGTEQDVRSQDRHGAAIDGGDPPRVPDVVEHDEAAVRAVGIEDDAGVGVESDGDLSRAPRLDFGWRVVEQNCRVEIDRGPVAVTEQILEIGWRRARRK